MAEHPSPDASTPSGRVIDRRLLPPGVVPRHLQQWVLIGIALVMVGILALSGPPAPPRATAPPSPASAAVDPNQQRIEDYQRRIQEQAQRLAAEQAQLQLAKQALAADPGADPAGVGLRQTVSGSTAPTANVTPARDTAEDRARVADNVAFSRSASSNATPTRAELRRDTYVAHVVFVLKDAVDNARIPINPLGLTITYFRDDQAFVADTEPRP